MYEDVYNKKILVGRGGFESEDEGWNSKILLVHIKVAAPAFCRAHITLNTREEELWEQFSILNISDCLLNQTQSITCC